LSPSPPVGDVRYPPERLQAALRAARTGRSEWLLALASGTVSFAELVDAARCDDGRALRALPLMSTLASVPGWSPSEARRAVLTLLRVCRADPTVPASRVRVGWLVNRQSFERRWAVLVSAAATLVHTSPLAAGFPYVMPAPRLP